MMTQNPVPTTNVKTSVKFLSSWVWVNEGVGDVCLSPRHWWASLTPHLAKFTRLWAWYYASSYGRAGKPPDLCGMLALSCRTVGHFHPTALCGSIVCFQKRGQLSVSLMPSTHRIHWLPYSNSSVSLWETLAVIKRVWVGKILNRSITDVINGMTQWLLGPRFTMTSDLMIISFLAHCPFRIFLWFTWYFLAMFACQISYESMGW